MNVYKTEPRYSPITIVLETQADFDKMLTIVGSIAQNRVDHAAQTIDTAQELLKHLFAVSES